ncbi:MAG TPA: MerC domain-containing protein, partial [Polyangiales bacterium]|nr:MerC domain-containing protein [Polyangiales bacterium]
MPTTSHRASQPVASERASERALERAATWLSLACAVHCLVMPLAMGVLPLLGASQVSDLSPGVELLLSVLVVGTASIGVFWGYRRHRDARIVTATGIGVAAYLLGHLFEDSWPGVALAVVGALVLAASSFLSARLSHVHDPHCAH